MERITHGELVYYRFDGLGGVRHGIFTRLGGVSAAPWGTLNLGGNVGDSAAAVHENHARMYEALGARRERACSVWQVHGADVLIASQPVRGRRWLAAADALVTDRADTPLAMRFADCVPLLFHDPVKGVIGMAHAGWRGTVQGVGVNTVRLMASAYGCKLSDIRAGIGPSIGPAHYQVGEEVVQAVQTYFGTLDGLVARDPTDGTAYLDLWEANRRDLQRAGVEQIECAEISTASHTDEFFSHRAEHGRTGRFGAVLTL